MAASVFECGVCNEDYDTEDRKPLCLLCGHTFCRKCIECVFTKEIKSCPSCRQVIEHTVDTLPVNYVLITTPPKNPAAEKHHLLPEDRCPSHELALDYICENCSVIVCRKCSKQSHAKHNVEFIDDVVGRDDTSKDFITKLNDCLQAKQDSLTKSLSLSNEISQSVNEVRVEEEGLQEYKDLSLSLKALADQDLKTWQDSPPESSDEKRKLFKKLCKYWRLRKTNFPEQETSSLCKKLDELSAAAKKVMKDTEALKSHLQPKAVSVLAPPTVRYSYPCFEIRNPSSF